MQFSQHRVVEGCDNSLISNTEVILPKEGKNNTKSLALAESLSWLEHRPNMPWWQVWSPVRACTGSNQWMHRKVEQQISVSLSHMPACLPNSIFLAHPQHHSRYNLLDNGWNVIIQNPTLKSSKHFHYLPIKSKLLYVHTKGFVFGFLYTVHLPSLSYPIR